MPHALGIRRAAVAAGLALAALPATVSGATSAAADVHPRCAADEVAVVVDFNELGGPTRQACAKGSAGAAELFEASGFALTYARAPGMQGFVCSVAGRPAEGPCTDADAYWSLWWSPPGAPASAASWSYATLGVSHLEVEAGGAVGFAWHEGDDDAAPPDVSREPRVQGAPEPARPADETPDGAPTWLLLGGGALVLGAAGAVPLLRRRRSG